MMPLAGRVVAAVAGGLLVLAAVSSVTATLIVSRQVNSRLTRWVDRAVDRVYEQVAWRFADYRQRDRMRATQAAAVLLGQLATWQALCRGCSPRRVRQPEAISASPDREHRPAARGMATACLLPFR
jgi:hypothetical protein